MKIHQILSICTAMALLSSGCSDMGLQPEQAPAAGQGQTLRIAASLGQSDSRLAYNETETQVNLLWEESDVLKVVNPSRDMNITDFTLVEGAGTNAAEFEGTPENVYQEGDEISALYYNAFTEAEWDADGNVQISLAEQTGKLNPDNQVMFGSSVYQEGESLPGIHLKNLVSVLKVQISSAKDLMSVTLHDNSLRNRAVLVVNQSPSDAPDVIFKTGDLIYPEHKFDYDESGSWIEHDVLSVTGPFPSVDGKVTVYLYVLPIKRYDAGDDYYYHQNVVPTITVMDVDGEMAFGTTIFEDKFIEQGRMYEMRTNLFRIVDFENEATADGSASNPYLIATTEQMYSFMLRCKHFMQNDQGEQYNRLSYKLSADLKMNNMMKWESFDFYGTFDGDGHIIYGYIGGSQLFFYLEGATISNLILNLDSFETATNNYYAYGMLGGNVQNSTLINCINYSTIDVDTGTVGGLVGCLNNSQMIGCANYGKILTYGHWIDLRVGGLAAEVTYNSLVEACLSTGSIQRYYQNVNNPCYMGGLFGSVGYIYDANSSNGVKVNGCWTTGVISVNGESDNFYLGSIMGWGNTDVLNACYGVGDGNTPTAEQFEAMNAALTNPYYEFDTTTGRIVARKPATSLPEFDIEDF